MAIKDALLPEFDYEMANTRKVLERSRSETYRGRRMGNRG